VAKLRYTLLLFTLVGLRYPKVGLRGASVGRWLVVAGLLMLLGIALLLADIYSEMIPSYLHLKESPSFRWTLNKPGDFLTLLMFFWMGNWIRKFVMTAEPLSKTLSTGFKLAISAGILYLLDPMWEALVTAVSNSKLIPDTLHTRSPAGSNYLLPLIALLLSITRRIGMLIAITLVGTYYLLYGIDSTATASLLPVASATKKSTLKPEDWERQHDEISNTVRRVMLTVLAYSVFCGLTRVMFFTFCLLFALQMASGGAMVKRSLMLEGANLENTKLSGANLLVPT
jgi:hypothetical protein